MGEKNPKASATPALPLLDDVMREGDREARRQARDLVKRALKSRGVIDIAEFERAGPQVRAIYMELLAKQVVPPEPKPAAAQRGAKITSNAPKAAPKAPVRLRIQFLPPLTYR